MQYDAFYGYDVTTEILYRCINDSYCPMENIHDAIKLPLKLFSRSLPIVYSDSSVPKLQI